MLQGLLNDAKYIISCLSIEAESVRIVRLEYEASLAKMDLDGVSGSGNEIDIFRFLFGLKDTKFGKGKKPVPKIDVISVILHIYDLLKQGQDVSQIIAKLPDLPPYTWTLQVDYPLLLQLLLQEPPHAGSGQSGSEYSRSHLLALAVMAHSQNFTADPVLYKFVLQKSMDLCQ